MTGISVTRSPSEPVFVGQVVRATAVGSGGVAPLQYKYVLTMPSSGPAVRVREWSTDPTFETLMPVEGTFQYEVWGRSAGVTVNTPQVLAYLILTALVPPSGPMTSIGTSSDVPSPRPAMQPVKFYVGVKGGTAPAQYQWRANGVIFQDWTTVSPISWTPASAGTYTISVRARSAGSTSDAGEISDSFFFTITAPTTPQMNNIRWGTYQATKGAAGTTLYLDWAGEGGTPPYQFRVEYRAGNDAYQLVRDWSSASSIEKLVTVAGGHSFRVSGRSAGSTTGASEYSTGFSVTVMEPVFAAPPTSVTLTANKPSPQPLGATIGLNAVAAGPATSEYKYQFQLGSGPVVEIPGWGTPGNFAWTPSAAGTYTITVLARQLSGGDSAPRVSASMTFVISP
jgi:cell wall-associated protease